MRKITILFIIEYLAYGGTEKQLMALIEGMDKSKFDPYLCCLRHSIIGESRRNDAAKLYEQVNCKKIRLDFDSFKKIDFPMKILKLLLFIKRNQIDVIQTFFQDPTIFGVIAGKLCGIKNIIASFRDMAFWYETNNYRKLKLFYQLCSHYVANSNAVRDKYADIFNLPEEKFTVIYNGVACESVTGYSGKIKQNSDLFLVGILANLNRGVKRVDVFLKAAALVLKQSKNIRFIIMGDGELKHDLYNMAEELEIVNSVDFVGRVNNISEWLSNIDIGINSSDSEGLPNSILEFMAAGIPVIATDVGGNSEVVVDGISGFLVPNNDFNSMSEKIIQLTKDKELYLKMKSNSLRIVQEKFNMQNYYIQYEKMYESLMSISE